MNPESGQSLNWLGCDFVDSALTSITELWDQHCIALQTKIIEICNCELRSDIPTHLATPSSKRRRRFTSAQKALQKLLNNASATCTTAKEAPARKKGRPRKGAQKDEVDNKVLPCVTNMVVNPILQPDIKNEFIEDNEDPEFWHVKRTSPTKKEKFSPPPITVTNHDEVLTLVNSNIKKQPEEALPESEWTTDDESFESIESIGDETYQRMTGKKSLNSSHKLSTIKKQKRKQTEYFTPSIPRKSKRITRATANKVENTPKGESLTKSNLLAKASSASKFPSKLQSAEKSSGTTTSGSSIASSVATITSVGRSDSAKGKRAIPRTPDTKVLTASAAKRRLEEEEKRKAALAQMKEKEEKAIQSKQENLKMKAQITKLKNEEKRKKIEQIKAKEEEELKEKRAKELCKTEEIEKRRREKEEARKREMQRNQDTARKKQLEFELRKQQEEDDRKLRLLKLEEQNRQKKEENERIKKEEEKMMRLIAKHNSNFYDSKKVQNTSASQQKVDQPAVAVPTISQFKQPLPPVHNEGQPQPQPQPPSASAASMNKTFDKETESVKKVAPPQIKVESYQITPPPKPKPMPVNYDISDIKSDDDTDDEERPKKLIPSWAKGDALIAALDKQFAKSRRARERQIREIFPSYDFSIQLADIFKSSSRIVHPKYDKRTSSAVWSSPPCNSTFNCSMLTDDC